MDRYLHVVEFFLYIFIILYYFISYFSYFYRSHTTVPPSCPESSSACGVLHHHQSTLEQGTKVTTRGKKAIIKQRFAHSICLYILYHNFHSNIFYRLITKFIYNLRRLNDVLLEYSIEKRVSGTSFLDDIIPDLNTTTIVPTRPELALVFWLISSQNIA